MELLLDWFDFKPSLWGEGKSAHDFVSLPPGKEPKKRLFQSAKMFQKTLDDDKEQRKLFFYRSILQIMEATNLDSKSIKQRNNFLTNLYQVRDLKFLEGILHQEVLGWIEMVEASVRNTIAESVNQVAQNVIDFRNQVKNIHNAKDTPMPLTDLQAKNLIRDTGCIIAPKFTAYFTEQVSKNYSRLESLNFAIVRHRLNLLTGSIDQIKEQNLLSLFSGPQVAIFEELNALVGSMKDDFLEMLTFLDGHLSFCENAILENVPLDSFNTKVANAREYYNKFGDQIKTLFLGSSKPLFPFKAPADMTSHMEIQNEKQFDMLKKAHVMTLQAIDKMRSTIPKAFPYSLPNLSTHDGKPLLDVAEAEDFVLVVSAYSEFIERMTKLKDNWTFSVRLCFSYLETSRTLKETVDINTRALNSRFTFDSSDFDTLTIPPTKEGSGSPRNENKVANKEFKTPLKAPGKPPPIKSEPKKESPKEKSSVDLSLRTSNPVDFPNKPNRLLEVASGPKAPSRSAPASARSTMVDSYDEENDAMSRTLPLDDSSKQKKDEKEVKVKSPRTPSNGPKKEKKDSKGEKDSKSKRKDSPKPIRISTGSKSDSNSESPAIPPIEAGVDEDVMKLIDEMIQDRSPASEASPPSVAVSTPPQVTSESHATENKAVQTPKSPREKSIPPLLAIGVETQANSPAPSSPRKHMVKIEGKERAMPLKNLARHLFQGVVKIKESDIRDRLRSTFELDTERADQIALLLQSSGYLEKIGQQESLSWTLSISPASKKSKRKRKDLGSYPEICCRALIVVLVNTGDAVLASHCLQLSTLFAQKLSSNEMLMKFVDEAAEAVLSKRIAPIAAPTVKVLSYDVFKEAVLIVLVNVNSTSLIISTMQLCTDFYQAVTLNDDIWSALWAAQNVSNQWRRSMNLSATPNRRTSQRTPAEIMKMMEKYKGAAFTSATVGKIAPGSGSNPESPAASPLATSPTASVSNSPRLVLKSQVSTFAPAVSSVSPSSGASSHPPAQSAWVSVSRSKDDMTSSLGDTRRALLNRSATDASGSSSPLTRSAQNVKPLRISDPPAVPSATATTSSLSPTGAPKRPSAVAPNAVSPRDPNRVKKILGDEMGESGSSPLSPKDSKSAVSDDPNIQFTVNRESLPLGRLIEGPIDPSFIQPEKNASLFSRTIKRATSAFDTVDAKFIEVQRCKTDIHKAAASIYPVIPDMRIVSWKSLSFFGKEAKSDIWAPIEGPSFRGPNTFGESLSLYPTIPDTTPITRLGDPIADSFRALTLRHGSIFCLADGCGWGAMAKEASLRIRDNFVSYLAQVITTLNTTKELSRHLTNAVAISHYSITYDKSDPLNAGSSTLIGGIMTQVAEVGKSPWCFVYTSVGDCKAFRVNMGFKTVSDLNPESQSKLNDARDPGGRLGSLNANGSADLRNFDIGFCTLNEGDFIILCSDGVSNNLDPEVLGHNPKSIGLDAEKWTDIPKAKVSEKKIKFTEKKLQELIFHSPNDAVTPGSVVKAIMTFVRDTTAKTRSFMEKNPSKNQQLEYQEFPGKLDHATMIVVQAKELLS